MKLNFKKEFELTMDKWEREKKKKKKKRLFKDKKLRGQYTPPHTFFV